MYQYTSKGYRFVDRDDEYPSIRMLRKTTRTARKGHRCSCCEHPISAGDKYMEVAYVEDGTFYFERIHDICPPPPPIWYDPEAGRF